MTTVLSPASTGARSTIAQHIPAVGMRTAPDTRPTPRPLPVLDHTAEGAGP